MGKGRDAVLAMGDSLTFTTGPDGVVATLTDGSRIIAPPKSELVGRRLDALDVLRMLIADEVAPGRRPTKAGIRKALEAAALAEHRPRVRFDCVG